jgi:hypothetical protein
VLSLLLGAVLLLPTQDKKLPVPEPAALKEAEKLVRDTFKAEYSRKAPQDRIALAKKLFQQGAETTDNDNARYVLLREAGDLAAQNGEATLALQAISLLQKRYQVNGYDLKFAALATVGRTMKTPEEFAGLARSYLALADDALAAGEFDAAEKAGLTGGSHAKKGKDLALFARLDAKCKEAGDCRARAAKVLKAFESLEKNPDDAEAHSVVGQYLVLVRGEWDDALPHLARGADAALKAAAEKDLSKPTEPADQAATGDLWWDLAEKDATPGRIRFRSRAGLWFLKAREHASGLTRTRIEKRLDAAGMLPPVRPSVDLLKLIDLQQDTVQGRWQFIDGKLVSPAVFMARLEIPYSPPEEYDLVVVVECGETQDSINLGLVAGDRRFLAVVDGWDPPRTILSRLENQGDDEAVHMGRVIVSGKPNTVVCAVRKNRLSVKVNDQLLIDWQGDYQRLSLEKVWGTPNSKAMVIGAYLSTYRFSKITLIPVTGEGKKLR